VRFVIGRGGYGKTNVCLNEICEALQVSAEGSPLIWIVPEQGSFQAEYAIISRPELRGSMRAEVLGFRRLAHRLMQQERGTSRIYIDDSGKKMLLLKAVQLAGDQLAFYRSQSISDGLMEQMGRLFDEWKRNGVNELALEPFANAEDGASVLDRSLAAKLTDLLLIFHHYEEELSKHYVDAEDDLILLSNLIAHSEHLRHAEVWIDGFHGFTPLEMNVLTQLAIHCRRLTVTLCLDREYGQQEQLDDLNLFYRTAVTYRQLRAMYAKFQLDVEPTLNLNEGQHEWQRHRSEALTHLEATFEQRPAIAYTGDMDGIRLCPASNRRVEVESAAIEMIRLAREEGSRWREMAVMMRNIDDYLPLIKDIFPKYGIPFFNDQRRSVADHPLVEFVRASLQTVQRYWRYEDLFRAVKTGFFLPDQPSEEKADLQETFDLLENVVLAAGLERHRWLKDQYWERPVKWKGASIDNNVWKLLLRCRSMILQPLLALQKNLSDSKDVRGAVEAIYNYLCELRIPEKCARMGEQRRQLGDLSAEQDSAAIWSSIIHILDQNVEILGDLPFKTNQWIRTFDSGLEALKVGFVPPALDQVLIGSLDRTRAGDVGYMFLFGANEGVLPAKVNEKGLLSDHERNVLIDANIPLSPGSLRKLLDESFLLYTTVATCVRRLRVSFALGSESGKGLIPSGFIGQLYQMFPALKDDWKLVDLDYAKMTDHELFEALHHREQALQAWTATKMEDVGNSLRNVPELADRLALLKQAASYQNATMTLTPDAVSKIYGEELKGSVSRFELFSKCSFAHFAKYGLGLRERAMFELNAMHTGNLYHKVIETVIALCKEENRTISDLSKEQLSARVDEAVLASVGAIQHSILTSSVEHKYTLDKLTRVVTETLSGIAAHEHISEFQMAQLEWPFEYSMESFILQGIVDRLDIAEDREGKKWIRVIDYKSGSKKLDLDQLYHGISLQLLAYLDIAAELSETWAGAPAEVAGAFYLHVHDKLETSTHPLTVEQQEKMERKRYRMSGLAVDNLEVIGMMDNELRQPSVSSSVLSLRTVADGTIHSTDKANLLSDEQWQQLRVFTREKMKEIGGRIISGKNAIQPYKLKGATPCEYCDFKPVCQFDKSLQNQSYRFLKVEGKDSVLNKIAVQQATSE
jgi:ATP-dependent helicase/nuclease subunit B